MSRALLLGLGVSLLACNPEISRFADEPAAALDLGGTSESPPDLLPTVPCVIGAGSCDDGVASYCLDDGTVVSEFCDPVQGSRCNPVTHHCDGPCARDRLGSSYIGCDYYPTVTGNGIRTNLFHYALAVSNTTLAPTEVHIEGGELPEPLTFTVGPGSVKVQQLPWVMALVFGVNVKPASALVQKGAYRLRSDRPVTVYQFNALEYVVAGSASFTNDASLLLPVNVVGKHYRTVNWPAQGSLNVSPGLLAITATEDDTAVSITSSVNTSPTAGVPALEKGLPKLFKLLRGDVLQIFNQSGGDDFSGTVIESSRPVQVISGHWCTLIPDRSFACDHLEDVLFPSPTLGLRYLVTAPALPSLPDGKVEWVRIVATQPNTHLSYDPPQAAPTVLANAGDVIELPRNASDFLISADRKLVVAQYMASQSEGGDSGDPSMAVTVPIEQYRTQYLFHAPLSYQTNYANIIMPLNAKIILDGVPLTGLIKSIGTSEYGIVRYLLSRGENGNHQITGDRAFGVTVYGYGNHTSYWYPAGLDLKLIP